MPDSSKNSNKLLRRTLMIGMITSVVIVACGWLYVVKTRRDLNMQLLGAVKKNDTQAVIALLARGANPNIRDVAENRMTLWEQIGSVFRRQTTSPEDRKQWDSYNAENQMPTVLEIAIEPYSSSDYQPHKENLPLVKAILDAGARVNDYESDYMTPLMDAVSYDRLKTVQLLLDHGANPLTRNDLGQSPIHVAQSLKVAQLLVRLGNDVNATANDGSTPLMTLTAKDKAATMRFLISQGARVNSRAKDGTSALLAATESEDTEGTKMLLEHGAEVNISDKDRVTPLDNAANGEPVQIVKMLFEHGARVDPVDKDGDTPLTTCLESNNSPDIVAVLIAHGADVDHRNKAGETPLSLAKKNSYKQIIKLLVAAGAKRGAADPPTKERLLKEPSAR